MSTEIPASTIVDVNITTLPAAPSRAGFGTYLVVTQEAGLDQLEGLKFYSSIEEVAADWATTTEAYKAANTYFNQNPRPDSLYIGRRFATDQAALMLGGGAEETDIPTWQAITDGSFTLSIDGDEQDIASLDFNADADLDAVATTIETAIQAIGTGGYTAATFTHTGTQFKLVSGTTGASSTLSFMTAQGAGTDISSLVQMAQGEGTKANGIDAETAVGDALTRLQEVNNGWYAFGFTKETRDNQDVKDAAAWTESRKKQFYTVSNNEDSYNAAVATDIGYLLNNLGYLRTFTMFSSNPTEYPEVSAFARAATVDFNLSGSTITLKFKKASGITPESLNSAQAAALTGKGVNIYATVGGFDMIQEGMMSAGIGTWQDTIHGVDWMQNAIENNVFSYIAARATKVPYTDAGVATLEQQVINGLEEGVRNGLIARNATDSNGNFLPLGYSTAAASVASTPLSQRSSRVSPGITFVAVGAGAIHGITINGTFEG